MKTASAIMEESTTTIATTVSISSPASDAFRYFVEVVEQATAH